MQLATERREQARLAAAVGADQADLVSRVQRQIRAVEKDLRAARQRQVGDPDHRRLNRARTRSR
jgi:hypothetical protein